MFVDSFLKITLGFAVVIFVTIFAGQISDETWHAWWYPALVICPDGHSQNQ